MVSLKPAGVFPAEKSSDNFRLTVLLVDDRSENLVSLCALLESCDCRLLTASSGEQALRLLLVNDIALVLLDVQMPGMDGYEVARLIRGNPRTRPIPIIFITAVMREEEAVLRGYEVGAIDFMVKPINNVMLRSKVNVLLELEQSRRRLARLYDALSHERSYFSSILATAAEGILVISEEGTIVYCNPSACDILGVACSDLEATHFLNLVLPAGDEVNRKAWESSEFFLSWHRQETHRSRELLMQLPGQRTLPVMLSCAPLPLPHQGLVVVFQDISAAKYLQEQLQRQVVTDSLTGLLNRHGFMVALEQELARANRNNKMLAVLFVDLDGFKRINDAFGHKAGDELLRAVARRMRESLRPYDLVARLGGDEFTIIAEGLGTEEQIAHLAEKILQALVPPHSINGLQITVGASVGIAVYPQSGDTAEAVIQAADMAMFCAKTEGRNEYRFYNAEMNGRTRARLMLEESLRRAIVEQEFQLYFQPQIHIATGRLRGFEALLRWQHPTAGVVQPAIFVPVLEEAGLINQLGPWVIDNTCRQIAAWQSLLPPDGCIGLNLSSVQFASRDLVNRVETAIATHQINPRQLELECTESILMKDVEHTRQVLGQLRELGVRSAIDDFGTGYSSMAYLKQFEVDTLKIDKMFINGIPDSPRDAAIAQSITQLGHNLGMEIIAEGVETKAQADWLLSIGCNTAQGYFYGHPQPPLDAWRFRSLVNVR